MATVLITSKIFIFFCFMMQGIFGLIVLNYYCYCIICLITILKVFNKKNREHCSHICTQKGLYGPSCLLDTKYLQKKRASKSFMP